MDGSSAVTRMAAELRALVARGRPGERLPSVRALTAAHEASPVTVSRAFAMLAEEGLVVPRVGAGTFIADRPAEEPAQDVAWQCLALGEGPDATGLMALAEGTPPGTLRLASGYPDASLHPTRDLARLMNGILRADDAWERAPLAGLEELRAWFARRAGGGATAADVLIVGGGQAAIRTALQATTRPGDRVLLESPTYLGATAAARALGLEPVPVPVDAHGLRPDLLAEAFERTGAKVLYCQPAFQNPTGATLPADRRAEVLRLARRHFAFVIEDDYAADLAFDGPSPAPLFGEDDGHVIYLRSLTKSFAPSLRIAGVCARGPVMRRLGASRALDDFFVPRPLQALALAFAQSPALGRHLARMRAALAERMERAVACARALAPLATVPLRPRGGFSLWLELAPGGLDEQEVTRRAARAGVAVSPGALWYPGEPVGRHLRVSVMGGPPAVLDAGFQRLADALAGG
ncbi:MAG: PLP-dependent aminotransferase family protein [Deltaproteobacteria bacterium]|nr:PLP-dependent aminotransferase family protein [Deltaproteobacteria bacterium]